MGWDKLSPAARRLITSIFGGWPCPQYSQANPDRRGEDDARAWVMYKVILMVLSDPNFNYQADGALLSLGGENVIDKEAYDLYVREQELGLHFGYIRTSVQVLATWCNDSQARS